MTTKRPRIAGMKIITAPKKIPLALLILLITLFISPCPKARSEDLKMTIHEPLIFYFPERYSDMAAKLIKASDPMMTFLKNNGLTVTSKLHIVIDDKLDHPQPRTYLLPHREIRIPLRAPGVLEEGYLEPFPWQYFLFKGLCIQNMYNERSGIPLALHSLFGDLMTPNRVLPEWFFDSIACILYEKYTGREINAPLSLSIFNTGPLPALDIVSNHPEIWPGRYSYSIYGRPFVRWLVKRYGWDSILAILKLHGEGIVPIEIDLEAIAVFNQTWGQLWQTFKNQHKSRESATSGLFIKGYWPSPFVYWNDSGIYPETESTSERSRYGFADTQGRLWLSSYDSKGISRLTAYGRSDIQTIRRNHLWDPGPGGVAVTRHGERPYLVVNLTTNPSNFFDTEHEQLVEAPAGVAQLSGPMADNAGRVAVAGNSAGNWDIWLYDGQWHRVTSSQSVEMDPWIMDNTLIFASNVSGRFQIHNYDMVQITRSETAAILPRHESFIELSGGGWNLSTLSLEGLTRLPETLPSHRDAIATGAPEEHADIQPYSPFKSIWPNYVAPDIFIDTEDFQIGLSTRAQDVTGRYGWDTGVRYSIEDNDYSWRLGGHARSLNARATRYPFSYATERADWVNEIRHEIKLGWSPDLIGNIEISINWRHYEPVSTVLNKDEEWWGALFYHHNSNRWQIKTSLDVFSDNSQSLYGLISRRFGQRISTVARLYAGKTWGDIKTGHNTFRIGGNSAEGFFTYRPSRLFPLRGFDANILDADHAATANIETFWPLAKLQAGYKTLPLFLRNIQIGTFVDGGFAAEQYAKDELLVGAGFEIITGMELAWGVMADFRIGVAWPIIRPDDLESNSTVFLIQIGRPL